MLLDLVLTGSNVIFGYLAASPMLVAFILLKFIISGK